MKKPNSYSLGKDKLVYAREGDEESTIVVRNTHESNLMTIQDCYKVFGLKEIHQIEKLFYSILYVLKTFANGTIPKITYVRKEKMWEVFKVINESSDAFEELEAIIIDSTNNEDIVSIRFSTDNGHVNVKLNKDSRFPNFSFCNENDSKEFINCTGLFVGETIKLLEYMNTRFKFCAGEGLKMKTQSFQDDNFF